MQHNAAALAQNKAENFHLKNLAAGLFLCQFMQGPAEIGHCAKRRWQNFWIWDNRSGNTSGNTSLGRRELLTSLSDQTFKEK